MRKGTIEKFALTTIADAVSRFGILAAHKRFAGLIGAVLDVSGVVEKFPKREGICRLVIRPNDVPGFVIFANFPCDRDELKKRKIRKGSIVSVRGRLTSFGAAAVCLNDCKFSGTN